MKNIFWYLFIPIVIITLSIIFVKRDKTKDTGKSPEQQKAELTLDEGHHQNQRFDSEFSERRRF